MSAELCNLTERLSDPKNKYDVERNKDSEEFRNEMAIGYKMIDGS